MYVNMKMMSSLKIQVGDIYVDSSLPKLVFHLGRNTTVNLYWFKYLAFLVLQSAF